MRVAVRSLKRRHAVPAPEHCEPTIAREVRYWAPRFRGMLTTDDLRNEAWTVAVKCLNAFDPMRDTELSTYLTDALRKHFRRLIKRTLQRALLYTEEQREGAREYTRRRSVDDPSKAYDAAMLLRRLRSMSDDHQRLAVALARHGKLGAAAKEVHIAMPRARKMLDEMRRRLKGK